MQSDTRNVAYIITRIVSCPLTVLLNVLVIMAVKERRPRLQTSTNIMLVCVAITLTGLLSQPLFILCKTWQLFGVQQQ